jgi:hypothetical protein
MRIFLAAVVAVVLNVTAWGQTLPDADKQAIEQVISGQLQAFAADNGSGAFAFAAPLVKGIFPDPDAFMTMVKKGYQPVYRNKAHSFGESFLDNMGRPAQRVTITATDGKRYEAVYTMEHQPDGSWKIAGCYLIEIPAVDA